MRGLRRQRGHGTLYLVVTATESLIDSAPRRRPRLLKRLTQCGTRVYLLIQQSLSPVSIAQPMRSGGGSSSYLIINYQLFPKWKKINIYTTTPFETNNTNRIKTTTARKNLNYEKTKRHIQRTRDRLYFPYRDQRCQRLTQPTTRDSNGSWRKVNSVMTGQP